MYGICLLHIKICQFPTCDLLGKQSWFEKQGVHPGRGFSRPGNSVSIPHHLSWKAAPHHCIASSARVRQISLKQRPSKLIDLPKLQKKESSSLFTRNKENMSRLNTLPMGSITPQQSQHLNIHMTHSQMLGKIEYTLPAKF